MHSPTLPEERRAPAFSFYAKDFLVGVVTFSLSERGAYITLLAYQWDNGSVPDDARDRCRILGCTRREADAAWERIRDKFQPCGDAWRNVRLEQERGRQAERRAALAINGSKGGRPRKARDNQEDKQPETKRFVETKPNENQNESLAFSSSSSDLLSQRAGREGAHTHAGAEELSLSERAGVFCEYYADAHLRLIGVGYLGNPRGDYEAALRLAGKFTDEELRRAAVVWFGMEDDFATRGTRTIPKFASRASECVLIARKVVA